ncbi:MAG: SCO1664 family protein [Actinobacteria bacterium]|nr:SCO1664 family protein [Actinomycetota bacterium]
MSVPGATASDAELPEPADLLVAGELELKARMPYSSNATFLVSCSADGVAALAVYKPVRGERPLWDYPRGLYKREIAAYRLSEALGWGLVPLTVGRADAPLGEGSLQLFVPARFEQHYFTLYDDSRHHDALRRICALDLVINNGDRKSGHCLLDENDRIWAIDHGLSFRAEPKLRTVIWEFGGQPVPAPTLADIEAFVADGVPDDVAELLDAAERRALLRRAQALLASPCFPRDTSGRRYPWPLV